MAEQNLNHADVRALLVQVGGKRMSQYVRRHAFVDLDGFGGITNDPVELARCDWKYRIATREQPNLGLCDAPVASQHSQQPWGEHRVSILLPLALLDADQHAFAVDVGDLEVGNLGH